MNFHYFEATDSTLSPMIFDTVEDTYMDLSILPGSFSIDNSWDGLGDQSTVTGCNVNGMANDSYLILILVVFFVIVCGYCLLRQRYSQSSQPNQPDQSNQYIKQIQAQNRDRSYHNRN